MGPKRRLPRKGQVADGRLNLEAAAAERIDAVTAEPLHPVKFVEIMSPDGTLRLFYNTATLIRIATDRGMFMQPPHFREVMEPSLRRRVEEIEGRTFRFEKSNNLIHDTVDGNAVGIHVLHRHVYFDQIMDEFYLLNPAELYVCPSCYLHWIETRLIPHLTATRQRIEYVEGDPNPVIDPLDVLAHMQGVENATAIAAGDTPTANDNADMERVPLTIPSMDLLPDWDSPLVHIVFRRALAWKRHVRRHHSDTRTAAADYRLKDFLSQYISHYNRLAEEKYRKQRRRGDGADVGIPTLTVTRYWHINARYNRLRYNRIVEAVERAESHIDECVDRTAFPGEAVMNTFHSNDNDSSASDFICDSESSGSRSGYAGFPRFERTQDLSEEDDVDKFENCRKRRRASSDTFTRSSSSLNKGENEEGEEEEGEEEEGEEEEEEGEEEDAKVQQRQLFKRGILAPFPSRYRDLSYEERCVLDANSRRVFKPTVLYAPPGKLDVVDNGDSSSVAEEYIDWGQIGGTIDSAAVYVRDMQQRHSSTNVSSPENQQRVTVTDPHDAQSLRAVCDVDDVGGNITPTAHPVQRLMLDEDSTTLTTTTTMTPQRTFMPDGQHRLLLDNSDLDC